MNEIKDYRELFIHAIDMGIKFKGRKNVRSETILEGVDDIIKLGDLETNFEDLVSDFEKRIIPKCSNFGSNKFMGFPDSGNSPYAIYGALLEQFLQQNLINSSFCAPIATQIEIEVIQFFRRLLDFEVRKIENIWDVGGIVTVGGTSSNSIALLLSREHHKSNTMQTGVIKPKEYKIIVPKGIGHYSVRSAQMWMGCGNNVVEVEINGYRYDLDDLKEKLCKYKGEIMMVVAYAGDSRTMTIEHLKEVYSVVKRVDKNIWLHVDACNGFCLATSDKLKSKLDGINLYDSVTMDPHKMLEIPYTISLLIVKEPERLKSILTESDLIMKERLAFGQVTPFIGSKAWLSLKLWFYIKGMGKLNIGKMIDDRYRHAKYLQSKLENNRFVVLNEVDALSVVFVYRNETMDNVKKINEVNKKIYEKILSDGDYYVHSFPIIDSLGKIDKNESVQALRFFSGNSNLTNSQIDKLILYIQYIGDSIATKGTKV